MGTQTEAEEASNLPRVSVSAEEQEGHASHPATSLQGADTIALALARNHEGDPLVKLGADDQQVVSPCPNPVTSLEIHVDGSDLAGIDPPSHGLEVLVTVEKNNEDQSGQLDLANDITVTVCLDGINQAVAREGGSLESSPLIAEIQVDAVEAGTKTSGHGVDLHESLEYVDNAEARLATDDGSNGERKRQREDLEEYVDRALKSKTMSHTVSNWIRERMDTDGCSLTQLATPEDAPTATVLAADVQGSDCCGDTVVVNGMEVAAEHNEMTEVKPKAMPNAGVALYVQASESMDHNENVTDANNISGGTDYLNKPNAPIQGLHLKACQQAEQTDHGKVGTDIRISAEEADSNGTIEAPSSKDLKDGEGHQTARARPRKKRKIAMLVAYCGAGYQGMQKNPGAVTIEGLLEEALIKAGAMPENYDGNPRKVDWMRAARTDKGVSAVGQVVSGQFYVDPPGFVERVNEHLPKQIRLIGYKRVTPTFSAKKFCDRRRYEYVIPLFALDAAAHRDREAVLASEGTDSAFLKCQECSERGRKVPGAVCRGSHVFTSGEKQVVVQGNGNGRKEITDCFKSDADTVKVKDSVVSTNLPDDSFNKGTGGAPTESFAINTDSEMMLSGNSPAALDASMEKGESIDAFDGSMTKAEVIDTFDAPITKVEVIDASETTVSQFVSPVQVKEPTSSFQFGEAERTKLNRILNYYVGTHNFHNFTSRVKAEDPSAKRYIVSFETGDVFTVRNTAFVKCTVVGQSFMLHQIRKMIGLAIAIFRGCAPESMLHRALRSDVNVTIPTAPELGLFLDECMYPAYNQKWYDTHEEVSQKGYEAVLSQFKHEVIYEHIAATEDKEGQMALFLHSLNDRNYSDFASAREADAVCPDKKPLQD